MLEALADWRILVALEVTWAIVAAVILINQRRSATATLAWMLGLAFLPLIGVVVYRFIGPQRLARKRLKRQASRQVIAETRANLKEIGEQSDEHLQLARLAIKAGEAAPLRAHDLTLYTEGDATFAALLEAIDAATHHIHVEYYIWEPDRIGTKIRDRLIAKARQGVQVRLLVDDLGANKTRGAFMRPLVDAGAEVARFYPVRLLRFRSRPDFRTHRKIVVCDGVIGFVGGINIADSQSAEVHGAAAWRDTHLRIAGSAVRALQRVFVEDWLFVTGRSLTDDSYFPPPTSQGSRLVQVVSSGPDTRHFAIHKTLFAAMGQANRRLWITTPYFVPDEPIQTALVTAAHRGVDVRLILPRKGDSRLLDLANRSYVPELLEAGIKVYAYQPRFIHAKSVIIDDDIAMIGSANLDNRSFRLNFEVMVVAFDGVLTSQLASAFTLDLGHCEPIDAVALARDSKTQRFGQACARLLSPLL